jgi:hypothetical protein
LLDDDRCSLRWWITDKEENLTQIPPLFMDTVVAVGNRATDGSVSWVASGFFFGTWQRDLADGVKQFRTYLVTNRHVRELVSKPVLRANPQGVAPAREYELDPDGWVDHPDSEIDISVAGVPMTALQNEGVQVAFFENISHCCPTDKMTERGISEGDGVFLLGFPMSLVGGPRNAVIVRQGCIARVQDAISGVSKSFLIDGYVFPGNSGGPVFTRPIPTGIVGTINPSQAYLVGIVSSYLPYTEVAVSQQTRKPRIVFEENSGLSEVFPVESIQQTIDHYETLYPMTEDPADSSGPSSGERSVDG